MILDIDPLRHNAAFRRLFASQFVSGPGTVVSYVAVPWQLYTRRELMGTYIVDIVAMVFAFPVALFLEPDGASPGSR